MFAQARRDAAAASELINQARAREEAAKEREREMAFKARAAEEKRKMTDFVVQEYADLVRSLQGHSRTPSGSSQSAGPDGSTSSLTLVESLAEGKSGLQRLLDEFNGESEKLATEVHRLQGNIESLTTTLDGEREGSQDIRSQLSDALVQLDKYKADDNTAAKMVSRYMKFSQSTTDSLQKAMDTLRVRHAATTSTLNIQIEQFQKELLAERRETGTLRRALDELAEDISREAYGRRREISLRLSFLSREESLAENLRRWIRKSKEALSRASNSSQEDAIVIACNKIIEGAETLLESLNGQPTLEDDSPGSIARIIAAKDAVSVLTQELQYETNRRLHAELQLAGVQSTATEDPAPKAANAIQASSNMIKDTSQSSKIRSPQSSSSIVPAPESPSPDPPSLLASPAADSLISPISPNKLDVRQLPSDSPSPDTVVDEIVAESLASTKALSGTTDRPSSEAAVTTPTAIPEIPTLQPSRRIENQDTPTISLPLDTTSSQLDQVHDTPPDIPAIPDIVVAAVDAPRDSVAMGIDEGPPVDVKVIPFPHQDEPSSEVEQILDAPLQLVAETGTASDTIQAIVSVDVNAVGTSIANNADSAVDNTPVSTERPSLLEALAEVKHRYDDLQRAFRDCHIALRDLKNDIAELPPSAETVVILQTAVERLDDYNEDARVELEIRVSDEERVHVGYQTLLSVPGAISDEVDKDEMEHEIQAFIDGTDASVSRAMHQFGRKLEDLQHDIACVKQSLHELQASEEESETSSATKSTGWSAWAGGLLGSTSPVSPTPSFGSVMTSAKLRRSSSSSQMRRTASDSFSADPFASLGLRIPMPAHLISSKLSHSPYGLRSQRPRTTSASAMYLLGIGSRRPSLGVTPTPSRSPSINQVVSAVEEVADSDTPEELNSDVE
ncbi:unnamed protein product [Somion occarium]